MKIVVGGASGFVGSHLCPRLKLSGNEIVALDRSRSDLPYVDRVVHWDGETADAWVEEMDGADALVNLSGSSIAVKWTPENKKRIRDSRVGVTELLAEACRLVAAPPRVWVNASATGYYPPNREDAFDESGPIGAGFLGDVCAEWEAAILKANLPQSRRVALRTGVVLGKGGGAYDVFVKLVRFFIGGAAGSGRQWMSWVHIEDLVRMYEWAIHSKDVEGAYNASAPEPVRNAEFMAELRRAHGRPWAPPAPAFAIRLLGAMGGPDPSLALDGYRVTPRRAQEEGFEFRYPTLREALQELTR
jgi:uncharacterized protein